MRIWNRPEYKLWHAMSDKSVGGNTAQNWKEMYDI